MIVYAVGNTKEDAGNNGKTLLFLEESDAVDHAKYLNSLESNPTWEGPYNVYSLIMRIMPETAELTHIEPRY